MKASVAKLKSNPQTAIPPAEWEVRVNLAACYRLVAHHGMTDLIYTHISARVPGPEEHFLLNPYGQLFSEITASSLVKLDLEGNVLDETEYEINQAGFTIHSAIHGARPDVACVLHTHTNAGMAVSAQRDGLLPLTQHSMRFHNRLAYHDYEGIALDLDERTRLVRDLGERRSMVLRNHGLLVAGRTVPEAFNLMYYLERACQAQIAAQAGGNAPLNLVSAKVAEHAAQQFERSNLPAGSREWPALLRFLDGIDPSYRH
jgi:ribulose-5-phosphate 4-epimerase/fuculose-1-phosphate aldolase